MEGPRGGSRRAAAAALLLLALLAALLLLTSSRGDRAPPEEGPGGGTPEIGAASRDSGPPPLPPGTEDPGAGGASPRSLRGTLRGRVLRASDRAPLGREVAVAVRPHLLEPIACMAGPDGVFEVPDFPHPTPAAFLVSGEEAGVRHEQSLQIRDTSAEVVLLVEQRFLVVGTVRGTDAVPAAGVEVTVEGRASEQETTSPVPGETLREKGLRFRAELRSSVPEESVAARTDAKGRFRAFLGKDHARVEVRVKEVPGYQEGAARAVRESDWLHRADVLLEPVWSLGGVVLDEAGRPLAGARVVLSTLRRIGPGGEFPPLRPGSGGSQERDLRTGAGTVISTVRATADAEGRFAVSPVLPADEITLTIDTHFESAEGAFRTPRILRIDPRADRGLQERVDLGAVTLVAPAPPIRVRLVRPGGEGLAGARTVFLRTDLHEGSSFNLGSREEKSDAGGWISSAFLEEGVDYLALVTGTGIAAPPPLPRFTARQGAEIMIRPPPQR